MAPRALAISPSYAAVVRGIRELHKLALAGRDESPEADLIRDAADAPWEALSEIERKRARGLSEDLYSISDAAPGVPRETNPQAQARLNDAIEARQRGEWDRALELLRRWSAYITPALLSYLRGSIWFDAGDPETAVLFYEHASRLDPENGNYAAILLYTLRGVDPSEAQMRAEQILRIPESHPAVAVVQAIGIMFQSVRSLPDSEMPRVFRNLIPVIESTLARIETDDGEHVDSASHAMVLALLGMIHDALGEAQAALEFYSRGLQIDPYHDGLLTARGILLYGKSGQAITDFELAAQNVPPVIWPYFFLAHHYLTSGRFEDCAAACERGLRIPGPVAVKSELTEWIAISKAEQGFPAETIRRTFEKAVRLDPSNGRAQRNLSAFEDSQRPELAPTWSMGSEAEIRALGRRSADIQRLLDSRGTAA